MNSERGMDDMLVEYRRLMALLFNFLRCVAKKYYALSVSWYPQVADTLSPRFWMIIIYGVSLMFYSIVAYFSDLIIII